MAELSLRPQPPRLQKNFVLFILGKTAVHAPKVFDGFLGPLPILLGVKVGYDPEGLDPYMYRYESQEVLFAFRKSSQTRALLLDKLNRTLSLPINSGLKFHIGSGEEELTLSEILSSHSLPVTLRFARPESVEFEVGKRCYNTDYWGHLQLLSLYEEPYLWCLSIEGSGKVRKEPRVLPQNLRDVLFAPVVAIKGAVNPAAKVKEFVQRFAKLADSVDCTGDLFFQELAVVSHLPQPVRKVTPYIASDTFFAIRYKRRLAPQAPEAKTPCLPARLVPDAPKDRTSHFPSNNLDRVSIDACKGMEGPVSRESRKSRNPTYSYLKFADDKEHTYHDLDEMQIKGSKPTNANTLGTSHLNKVVLAPTGTGGTKPSAYAQRGQFRPPEGKHAGNKGLNSGVLNMETPPLLPLRASRKKHLDELTIDGLAVKLKELKLQKCIKKFREYCIDGVLLQKLSEDTLRTEFSLNPMELLRLTTFINEGHIPRTSR